MVKGTGSELEALEGLVGYMLRRAQVAVSKSFVASFSDLGIRQTQLGVLSVIEASPGLKPSRVGALLGIKRANVGPLLEDLERRGLIRREPAATDRRSHALFLSKEGGRLLAELHRREATHEALIASGLTEAERLSLLDFLKRIDQACRASVPDEALDETEPD